MRSGKEVAPTLPDDNHRARGTECCSQQQGGHIVNQNKDLLSTMAYIDILIAVALPIIAVIVIIMGFAGVFDKESGNYPSS